MSNIEPFLKMLEKGTDNALLRFSLGNEYLKEQDFEHAIVHLNKALEFDRGYSAAWKSYAKALSKNDQNAEAISAYEKGIVVAKEKGDMQAVKEMQVFLKRLKKN